MTVTTALKRHLFTPAVLMLSMLLTGNVLAQEAPDSSASEPVERELNLKECTSSDHLGPISPFSKRHFSASYFSRLAC